MGSEMCIRDSISMVAFIVAFIDAFNSDARFSSVPRTKVILFLSLMAALLTLSVVLVVFVIFADNGTNA